MKMLERICLVQFFLYDAQSFEIGGHCAFLGPNGTGKTVLLDAVQIAMLGAHGNYIKLNAQKEGGGRDRTIREYCLGALDGTFKRTNAQSYITLVFRDAETSEETSIGVAISASESSPKHEVDGMYIARGIGLELKDHLETIEGGEAPLRYTDFRHDLKVRGDKEKKTVLFENHAEKYIANMLLALGDRRRVDQKAFLSAFHKSVLLRNIESVDRFVRDFLIDARAINKQAAATQIERFKHLARMVAETQQQIARLTALESAFDHVRADAERAAGYDVLASTLARDAALETFEELKDEVATLESQFSEGEIRTKELANRVSSLEAEDQRANAAVQASEPLRAKAQAEEVLTALEGQAASAREPIERIIHALERALVALAAEPALADIRSAGAAALGEVTQAKKDLQERRYPEGHKLLGAALGRMPGFSSAIERLVDDAKKEADAAAELVKGMEARIRATHKHGVRLRVDTSRAMERFEAIGIEAVPVCSKLRVTDPMWQAAIESYLGGHREALLVDEGRVDDAVNLLLNLSGAERLPGARVVQAFQLKDRIGRHFDSSTVASMIDGSDPVAVAYIREQLGATVKVLTAAELRKQPRSMTADGGLSANYNTSTMRMLGPADFLLGKRFDPQDMAAIQRELTQQRNIANEAKTLYEKRLTIRQRLAEVLDTESRLTELRLAFGKIDILQEALARQHQQISAIDLGEAAVLDQALVTVRHQLRLARDEQLKHQNTHGGVSTLVRSKRDDRDRASETFKRAEERERTAKSHPDYRGQVVDDLAQRLHQNKPDVDAQTLIAECEKRASIARKAFDNKHVETMGAFRAFIDEYNYGLIDERSSWRKAAAFASEERKKLEDTTLGQRQKEAEEARKVAEQNFRTGVAVHIANAIADMRRTISEMNRILGDCPPFSHNERYKFHVSIVPTFEKLHGYIMSAARDADDMFLSEDSDASAQIMEMMQAPGGRDSPPNPLDDFRLMFAFEVNIMDGERLKAKLSERVVTGSGGEFRTPFYIIAGAALAHAYQLDREGGSGAAIMLLDEAFNKIDPANSLSASRFLETLGLQLIMTAPEDAYGKLVPMTDRIYEMQRYNDEIFSEATYIKPAARKLMTSDMVQEHPDLLDQMLSQQP